MSSTRAWILGIAWIAFALIAGALLGTWQSSRLAEQRTDRAVAAGGAALESLAREQQQALDVIARQMSADRAFAAYLLQALAGAEDPGAAVDTASVRDLLVERRDQVGFDLALVLGPGGRVLVDTSAVATDQSTLARHPTIARVIAGSTVATGHLAKRGKLYWIAAAPLQNGPTLGAILVIARTVGTEDAARIARVSGAEAVVAVADGSEPVLVAATLDAVGQDRIGALLKPAAARLRTVPPGGDTLALDESSYPRVRVLPIGEGGDAWLLSLPSEARRSEDARDLRTVLVVAGLGVLLVLGALPLSLARGVAKPLSDLDERVAATMANERYAPIPVDGLGAIARVGTAFNRLLSELRERQAVEHLVANQTRHRARREEPAPMPPSSGPDGDPKLAVGTVFAARYEVHAQIGEGPVSIVHRAIDRRSGDLVALRTYRAAQIGDEARLERLKTALRQAYRINDPGLATILDFGHLRGVPYVASEYVRGLRLREILAEGRPPFDAALHVGRQLARCLHAVHAAGMAHGAIKAENVMVEPSTAVRLLDLGASPPIDGRREADYAALPPGVVRTLSPEQVRGRPPDARSDVYAFGLLLEELFTGRYPYPGTESAQLCRAHLEMTPTPPVSIWRELPLPVNALILRCLDKDAAQRFAHAGEVLEALNACRGLAPVPASLPTTGQP